MAAGICLIIGGTSAGALRPTGWQQAPRLAHAHMDLAGRLGIGNDRARSTTHPYLTIACFADSFWRTEHTQAMCTIFPERNQMDLIMYADFSSPLCYLTSNRVDALRAAGIDVDWRAVEVAPWLPVTGRRLDSDSRLALEAEFAETFDMLQPDERLDWTMPDFVPKTEAAVAGYAEAYGAGVADDVRRLLFRAYWCRKVDIGNPEKLRKPLAGPILRGHSTSDPLRLYGYAVSMSRGPITTGAWRRIQAWQDELSSLGADALPVLVENGLPMSGPDVPRHLAKMISRLSVPVNPELPEPERYPLPRVRPPTWWAAQAGGRWLYPSRCT